MLKWIALFVALAGVWPAGVFLRNKPRLMALLATFVGFLPYIGLDDVDINVISFERYRGDSRGVEITLLDLAVLTFLVALPKKTRPTPLPLQRGLYFAAVVLSVAVAPLPLFAMFSVWKLARMMIVFAVVVRVADVFVAELVLGLGIGVLYEVFLSLKQRYLMGALRVDGNMMHPNSLAMAVNVVFPIAMAVALAQKKTRVAAIAAGGAALLVVMSLSRGAMAMTVLAALLVYLGSALRRLDGRKLGVAVAGVLIALLVVAKAWDTLVFRFEHAAKSSEHARVLFNAAASLMLQEHPFGVGMNQFSHVLSHFGYAARIGIPVVDRDGLAHHVYWLTAAETGWFGIASYLFLLGSPLVLAYRGAARFRDVRGDVMLGCGVSLTITYIQGTAEWIARQTAMSYLFWILSAIICSIWRSPR
ncbi:MAG: O-antigen ligase family protein [Sandaracinaceae bacterium]|nr:O-antigen ligase family protein [Sandaracinaceae bacterium]